MWKTNLNILAAVCVLIMTLAGQSAAVTHYVSPGQSIQAAIDASSNDDEIEVAPGTYNEDIDFYGKAVRLYSSGGRAVTTIDATGLSSSVVRCIRGEDANTVLEGFTITGGSHSSGGGMYNINGSSPTVNNCTFSENTATGEISHGGGMYNANGSNPTVTNCNFSGNTSSRHGGGMSNNHGSPTVTNCTFTNNSSVHWGGGMYNDVESHSTVTNCTFSGNISDTGGGGIGNFSSSPTVTNCTFSSNNSPGGGGMCNNGSSNPTVTNCILWGDIGGEIVDNYIFTTTVTYSDVQGGWGGTGNIDSDPCFVDADANDWRLLPSSPCVDTGDNNAPNLPATDIAGKPRVADGDGDTNAVVDMGAYEFRPLLIHNVTQDRLYETIQEAIDDANDDDEIEAAPGAYNEAIDFKGKAVRLYSSGGPEVTIIDANGISGAYHVVKCISGEDANTVLEGFTITGGYANGPSDSDQRGGGMHNYYSSPTVTNCIFSGNSAAFKGGGMSNYYSSPTVADCNFVVNSASSKGGGMYNEQSSPTVNNCSFIGNSGYEGGGIHTDWMNPTVANCTFSGNVATYGGGMNNNVSSPIVTNCTFRGNSADYGGGMLNNNDIGIPMITNCTFSDNEAYTDGGGMYNNNNCSPTVTNCVLWNDAPDEIFNNSSSPTVTYSDVEGGTGESWFGTGCIDADPCFVDVDNPDPNLWNLRLQPDSPCIDAGDTTAVPTGIFADADGNLRGVDDPARADTGVSVLGVTVDMGAYEFQLCRIAGDNNCDGVVDFRDVAILCGNWLAGTEPEL